MPSADLWTVITSSSAAEKILAFERFGARRSLAPKSTHREQAHQTGLLLFATRPTVEMSTTDGSITRNEDDDL